MKDGGERKEEEGNQVKKKMTRATYMKKFQSESYNAVKEVGLQTLKGREKSIKIEI